MSLLTDKHIMLANFAIKNNYRTIEEAFRNKEDDDYDYNAWKNTHGLNKLIINPYSNDGTRISREEMANIYIEDTHDLNPFIGSQRRLNGIKKEYNKNMVKQKSRRITRSMITASSNKKNTK